MIPSSASDGSGAGPRVLVVDDDPDWVLFVDLTLTLEGFQVVPAGSGEDALVMIGECEPDAIVLDIALPGIDGWEVLRRLSGSDRVPRIPVVVVSGRTAGDARRRVAERGGHSYLPKPCPAALLVRAVRSACSSPPNAPSQQR